MTAREIGGVLATLLLACWAAGCASAPETRLERATLEEDAMTTLVDMTHDDPTLATVLETALAYVVFPRVGEGALVVGEVRGYARLSEGSIGAQAGGQSYSELVIFRTADAWREFQREDIEFGADASATIVTAGAAASAPFVRGRGVFIQSVAGRMLEAAIGGQRITYRPR